LSLALLIIEWLNGLSNKFGAIEIISIRIFANVAFLSSIEIRDFRI